MELTISDETSVNMLVKPRYTTLAVTAGCHQRPFVSDDADDAVPVFRTSFSDGYNGNSGPECSSVQTYVTVDVGSARLGPNCWRAGRERSQVSENDLTQSRALSEDPDGEPEGRARLSLSKPWRIAILAAVLGVAAATVLLPLLGGGSSKVVNAASDSVRPLPAGGIDGGSYLLTRSTNLDQNYGLVGLVAKGDPQGPRILSTLHCDRVDFEGGRGLCLRRATSFFGSTEAIVFDNQFKLLHTVELSGYPSRARVSPDGATGRPQRSSAETATRRWGSSRLGRTSSTCPLAVFCSTWRNSTSPRMANHSAPPTSTSGESPSPRTVTPSTPHWAQVALPISSKATWRPGRQWCWFRESSARRCRPTVRASCSNLATPALSSPGGSRSSIFRTWSPTPWPKPGTWTISRRGSTTTPLCTVWSTTPQIRAGTAVKSTCPR